MPFKIGPRTVSYMGVNHSTAGYHVRLYSLAVRVDDGHTDTCSTDQLA